MGIDDNRNKDKGFVYRAEKTSPFNKRLVALIPPHPGQGSPVIFLKGQNRGILFNKQKIAARTSPTAIIK